MAELLVGANLPWLEYGQDFGASAWRPRGGVACSDRREAMRTALAQAVEAGAPIVRWWLLGDGRAGLVETPSGHRTRLDERVGDDLDAAIEALREAGLRAIFVLTDFLWFAAPRLIDGVQTGGRRHLVRDGALRAELVHGVFEPLARRYGCEPAIAGWDLCNEPEWATFALGTLDPRRSVSRAQMRAFLRETAAAFRAHARQPLTVGLASARWLSLVHGLGLDFHQVHWYDAVDSLAELERPVASRGLPTPLLLGEFPTRGSALAPLAIVEAAARAGYSGALAWSLRAEDQATDGAACAALLRDCAGGGRAVAGESARA
jgi:hypothetical protein